MLVNRLTELLDLLLSPLSLKAKRTAKELSTFRNERRTRTLPGLPATFLKKAATMVLPCSQRAFASTIGLFLASFFCIGCSSKPTPPVVTKTTPAQDDKPKIDTSINVEGLLSARLSEEELDFGWIRLFDNQSLMGWQPSSKADWRVDEESITVGSGEKGFLFTTSRFGDFELQLEFLADAKTNSGIFLRCPLDPKSPAKDCYELNIAPPDNPFPTGSLVERIKVNAESVGELDPLEWHGLHALVERDHVKVWVDGREAADYQDDTQLSSGYIGLQFREGSIRFRNVRVRPITYATLPAETMKDWSPSKDEGLSAKLDDNGGLRIGGAKGHVELLQSHSDFCLQAKVKTMVEKVNSGIFFRCIPGEAMNGYECQVHHGFEGDRRLPIDSGTGGIFRRKPARVVLSDEGRPTHVTLIADGPHIATWVDGVQVVDWIDDRADDPNPRKGRRLEAGTIQLQSHDAQCDVVFESLKLSPIQ